MRKVHKSQASPTSDVHRSAAANTMSAHRAAPATSLPPISQQPTPLDSNQTTSQQAPADLPADTGAFSSSQVLSSASPDACGVQHPVSQVTLPSMEPTQAHGPPKASAAPQLLGDVSLSSVTALSRADPRQLSPQAPPSSLHQHVSEAAQAPDAHQQSHLLPLSLPTCQQETSRTAGPGSRHHTCDQQPGIVGSMNQSAAAAFSRQAADAVTSPGFQAAAQHPAAVFSQRNACEDAGSMLTKNTAATAERGAAASAAEPNAGPK